MQIKSYAAAAGYLKDAVALPGLTEAQLDEIAALTRQADRGAQGIAVERIRPGRRALPDQRQYRLGRARAQRAVSVREAAAGLERFRPGDARPRHADQQDRLDRGLAVGLLRRPAHRRPPRPRLRRARRRARGSRPRTGRSRSSPTGSCTASCSATPPTRRPMARVRCSAGSSPTAGSWSRSSNTRTGPTTITVDYPDATGPDGRDLHLCCRPRWPVLGEREPAHPRRVQRQLRRQGLPELRPVFRQCRRSRSRSTPSARRTGRSLPLRPSLTRISRASPRRRSSPDSRR